MNTGASLDEGDRPSDDRLPWLESADETFEEGPSPWRIVALALLALALVAAAAFALYRFSQGGSAAGTGELINAQEGPYKVPPDEPGGMKVEGQGDTKFAASQGKSPDAKVDVTKMPEAPVDGRAVADPRAAGAGTSRVVTAVPSASGPLAPRAPAAAARPGPQGATGGGSIIQLGSFPTEAQANAAWSAQSKRFGYIASLGKSIERADVNGATTYRLRVNAGSAGQAAELCGKLKVAGEACFIPR